MYSTKKLKELRIKNQISIDDMAKKLNISPSYYCLIENKKRKLYYTMAIDIANIFDKKPDEIFYKKNS